MGALIRFPQRISVSGTRIIALCLPCAPDRFSCTIRGLQISTEAPVDCPPGLLDL